MPTRKEIYWANFAAKIENDRSRARRNKLSAWALAGLITISPFIVYILKEAGL